MRGRKLQPIQHFHMTNEIDLPYLRKRFNKIKEFYSTENYKYIHAKTIDNFLSNADNFFMKRDQQEVYDTLNEYLDRINSSQVDNITESLQLFNQYIRPLTPFFKQLKGFHMAFRFWIVILWTLCLFGLLYLLRVHFYFYIVLTALIIFFVARQLYYDKKKKTYGFMH
jgi:hypothetical protein